MKVDIPKSDKEGWNSYGNLKVEHYFINNRSLCEKYEYKCTTYYFPSMTSLEISQFMNKHFKSNKGYDDDCCNLCNYKLKQIVRLRRRIKRKRIVKIGF